MKQILLVLIVLFFSCARTENLGQKVSLYSDAVGVNVETIIPNDWKKHQVPNFRDDKLLLFSAYGNSDTSQQLVINVHKRDAIQNLRVLIETELADARTADAGINLLELKLVDSAKENQFAFFDYYTKGENHIYYSEYIVFSAKDRVVNIRISSIGDEKAFKNLTSLIRKGLKY